LPAYGFRRPAGLLLPGPTNYPAKSEFGLSSGDPPCLLDECFLAYTGGMPDLRDVDPRELRVPPSRPQADPAKLQRQIARFGRSAAGMPPPWVYESSDGVLLLYNGVTRATRIAKQSPGTLIRVEVVGKIRRACAKFPKIGDVLP
jgi:hypothetical protein